MTTSTDAVPDPLNLIQVQPRDLPAPPQAAIALVQACTDEEVSNARLAELAAAEPVLTAELLRIVNSAYFGFSRKISTVPHAVGILGLRALKNLALCLAVRDALNKDTLADFDVDSFWEDALRRAVCARLLAGLAKTDAEEAFTAGLLQDFGLLVLFHLFPEKAPSWVELRALAPDARQAREQALFAHTHTQVVGMLAAHWGLPEPLTDALQSHHLEPELEAKPTALTKVLYGADWLAAIFTAQDKAAVLDTARSRLASQLGVTDDGLEAYLVDIPQALEEAGSALRIRVTKQVDFDELMRSANAQLAQQNLSYQELVWELEKAIAERDELAENLRRELELAREIQRSLLPAPADDSPVVGINMPARELSGDFYDYFRLSDGRVYFCLGDVSGKGTNAALLMVKTSALFHCLGKRVDAPGQLLQQINQEICDNSIRGMFVTMVAGLYDQASGALTIANAGHEPTLFIGGDGKAERHAASAPPLGIDRDTEFPEQQFNLRDGCLYLYTDGVTEGRIEGQVFGVRGLFGAIAKLKHLPTRERIRKIAGLFKPQAASLHDDVTLLLVENAKP